MGRSREAAEPPSPSRSPLGPHPPQKPPTWRWVCQGGGVYSTHHPPLPRRVCLKGTPRGRRRQGREQWPLPRPRARHTPGAEAGQGSPIPQATRPVLAECGCRPGLRDSRPRLSTWCHAASPGQEALGRALRDQLLQLTTLIPGRTSDTPGAPTRPWTLVPNQNSFPHPWGALTHRARQPLSEPWPPMGQGG